MSAIQPLRLGPFKIHFIRMFREEMAKNEPFTMGMRFYNSDTVIGRFSSTCITLGGIYGLVKYFGSVRPAQKEKARIAALKQQK